METWTQQRDGATGHVLTVDDDASVRLVCALNLEAEGSPALEAADGRGALEQTRRECPDLVLTDGFQLAERLRGAERAGPSELMATAAT